MNNSTNPINAQNGTIATKTAYEGSIIVRAIDRAGNNPHLKGHIQEIIVKDMRNARNVLTLNGASTHLTRETTATTVDLVTTRAGKVVERIQVKDVTSQTGIDKLVKQCADGKYRSARLVGSEETAEVFNRAAEKAGIPKRMTGSGVSSKTTESLAQRAGATGSGTLGGAMARAARTGGLAGAAVGVGVAAVKGCIDMAEGNADAGEVLGSVAKAGAKGGIAGASASAAATAAGAGAAAAISALGLGGLAAASVTIAAPLVAAVAVGYIASELLDGVYGFFGDLF